ncbi:MULTISPECIES: heavy-metal-associated domain-containing protein [unclassified Enterococcus]|uniref:heavy-metal-associated domain-containing protein n=1 Tax=unclassified Enterococcus TaxID=2608891 RepID=UPI001CE0BB6A|nr:MULTISPECIES: heavy metal-associated domain-containing protein [unclassified Enterococcus]MCA5014000.1 heavy-metal-associated domain-containing protein [Enterococcus sp. S23]MCA5017226.1 heavy-metal-associated domain-containing protein [Enterococcus sp. S22(2020)]
MEKTVTINGMKCDGCVNIVKENFESIAGVQQAAVDLEKKSASITSDREISNAELQQALSETKFTVA